IQFRESVPVNEKIRATELGPRGTRGERCSVRVAHGKTEIGLLEFALELEIKLLPEIAADGDARTAEAKTIFVCAGAFDEATLKSRNVANLILPLDETT